MKNYTFEIHKNTYEAVTKWLEILEEYDDTYLKTSISQYKSRRIQQKAFSKPDENTENVEKAYFEIGKNENIRDSLPPSLELLQQNIDPIYEKLIQINVRPDSLSEGFENLSGKISLFVEDDDDDNLIDFLK